MANGNGSFSKWLEGISMRAIGYLVALLVTILILVIGYNFTQDSKAQECANAEIKKLWKEKADNGKVEDETKKLREDINTLRKEQREDFKDLNESISDLKDIMLKRK